MRIDQGGQGVVRARQWAGEDRTTRETSIAEAVPAREDAITLSPRAQDVQKVKRHLASLPEMREARVAEVKARVQRGDYHVSSEQLADRILESGDLDLL